MAQATASRFSFFRNSSDKSPTGSDGSPDYVLLFRTPSRTAPESEAQLEKLLRGLDRVGLEVEVRHGGKGTLLLFIRCSTSRLNLVVRKARYLPM